MGVLNYYLNLAGLGRPPWLSDPTLALVSITLVDAWRTIPFMFLVMYAGLEVLPGRAVRGGVGRRGVPRGKPSGTSRCRS